MLWLKCCYSSVSSEEHQLHQPPLPPTYLLLSDCNRRFPSCLSPLFQSESYCEAFHLEIGFIHMEMNQNLHVNKTNFHMKGNRGKMQLGNRLLFQMCGQQPWNLAVLLILMCSFLWQDSFLWLINSIYFCWLAATIVFCFFVFLHKANRGFDSFPTS